MAKDHTALNQQLKLWASAHGVSLPTEISSKDRSLQNKLAKLSGKEFDKEYIRSMLEDHQKDVSEVQQAALNAKNPSIKGLAVRTLPVLENHLLIAANVAGRIGLNPKPGLTNPELPEG